MNVLIITLASIGSIGLLLIGFVLAVITWNEIQEKRVERSLKKEYLLIELGIRRLGAELTQDNHWFSEDTKSMNLVRAMGDCLSKEGRLLVSQVREDWRSHNRRDNIKRTGLPS